jgi:hypothetical protein
MLPEDTYAFQNEAYSKYALQFYIEERERDLVCCTETEIKIIMN